MREIYAAAREGAGGLPVSIKTRIGIEHDTLEEWLAALLELRPAAITLHARTVRELSNTAAHWDAIARAVRQACGSGVPIIGNGDVRDPAHGRLLRRADRGRRRDVSGVPYSAIPGCFTPPSANGNWDSTGYSETMLGHAVLFDRLLGQVRPFVEMRRHFKAYLAGFPDTRALRVALMGCADLAAARDIVASHRAPQRACGRQAQLSAAG